MPFPSPGDLSDPGMKPGSPATQADYLPSEPPGKPFFSLKRTSFNLYWKASLLATNYLFLFVLRKYFSFTKLVGFFLSSLHSLLAIIVPEEKSHVIHIFVSPGFFQEFLSLIYA